MLNEYLARLKEKPPKLYLKIFIAVIGVLASIVMLVKYFHTKDKVGSLLTKELLQDNTERDLKYDAKQDELLKQRQLEEEKLLASMRERTKLLKQANEAKRASDVDKTVIAKIQSWEDVDKIVK